MSDIEIIREWFRCYAGGISRCSIPAAEDLLIRLGKERGKDEEINKSFN